MQKRKPYIMHDQVRNQVAGIMAWKPHRDTEAQPLRLSRLLSRMLQRAADATRGFQVSQNAHHAH